MRLTLADPGNPTAVEAFECVYAFPQTLYIFRKGYSVTANMAARRSVFDAVGPFAGIGVSEDRDWGQRARAMGHVTRWRPDVDRPPPGAADDGRAAATSATATSASTSPPRRPASPARRDGPPRRWRSASPLAEIPRIARTDRVAGFRDRRLAFQGLAGFRLYRAKRMLQALVSAEVRTASTRWNRADRGMAGRDGGQGR